MSDNETPAGASDVGGADPALESIEVDGVTWTPGSTYS